MSVRFTSLLAAYSALLGISFGHSVNYPRSFVQNSTCRYLPGDAEWPSLGTWQTLNSTVGGRLIKTSPLASVCHDPNYDQEQCAALKAEWMFPEVHVESSSSIMAPWFQNASCDPFTPRSAPCELGSYAVYSINVSKADDVVAGVRFAQRNNIRLVIKNTGHDLLGKSTGQGAIGIWMHSLNHSDYISHFNRSNYNGPAFRLHAGILGSVAYEAAHAKGLRIVGGDCGSVGIAGGYLQGGGHSILSSAYGMGADQVLEWEVVTAQGDHITATPEQHSDLYWALSGGGPGTYAVVISVTVRAYRDGVVGGANITIPAVSNSDDTIWDAVEYFHSTLPGLVDTSASSLYTIEQEAFSIGPVTAVGANSSQVSALLSNMTNYLDSRNVSYTYNVTSFPTFLDHFLHYFGPAPWGPWPIAQLTGGRLIPRSVMETNNSAVTAALRDIVNTPPFYVAGFGVNTAGKTPVSSNAVLPAWREAIAHIILPGPWNFTLPRGDLGKSEDSLRDRLDPNLHELTPGSGTYLNEADFEVATWKQDFYGANYDRLNAVKAKYDPENLFYAITAVGSDAWVVAGDGRLCRA